MIEMHLMDHPYYSQMIYDLPEEIKKTFTKELPDVRGMDVMRSLADTLDLLNPIKHFNRFIVLVIVILVLAIINLLALKYSLAYLHKFVKQNDREKALFTVRLHDLQHS